MTRDAEYYRELIKTKWVPSVGIRMAANAVYAARFGMCDTEELDDKEWLLIAERVIQDLRQILNGGSGPGRDGSGLISDPT